VGGDPAMGSYRFCFYSDPTNIVVTTIPAMVFLQKKFNILYFAHFMGGELAIQLEFTHKVV